jgi:hypothetical protein
MPPPPPAGTTYLEFVQSLHLPAQLAEVDPIVASFCGGWLGPGPAFGRSLWVELQTRPHVGPCRRRDHPPRGVHAPLCCAGGAVGVVSSLLVIELTNVKKQQRNK